MEILNEKHSSSGYAGVSSILLSYVENSLSLLLAIVLICCSCSSPPEKPNIVLVVLDTVRRDLPVLGKQCCAGQSLTPHLDELGAEGTVFTNAWANAPWTVPSHASLFTGLLPSVHQCTGRNLALDTSQVTLAELLAREGYETASFFSNPWLTDRMTGMMRGFQYQFAETGAGTKILHKIDQGGPESLRNISKWLKNRTDDKPFFMFVNFLESHLPYNPPAEFRRTFLPRIPPGSYVSTVWASEFNAGLHAPGLIDWYRVRCLYAGDVNRTDLLLGELVSILRGYELFDSAVMIITSDHGENLGDHGYIDHQFGVFETLLAVPLVIRIPGAPKGKIRDDPVMLTDYFYYRSSTGWGERHPLPASQPITD